MFKLKFNNRGFKVNICFPDFQFHLGTFFRLYTHIVYMDIFLFYHSNNSNTCASFL